MKDILIALLIIVVVILVFGAVNQDQHIDFNYIAGTWHGASTFGLAGIGAGVTLFAGLGVAAVARMHVLGGRRKLEREVAQVYTRLRAAENASPAAAEASRAALHVDSAPVTAVAQTDVPPILPPKADVPALPAEPPALAEADLPMSLATEPDVTAAPAAETLIMPGPGGSEAAPTTDAPATEPADPEGTGHS